MRENIWREYPVKYFLKPYNMNPLHYTTALYKGHTGTIDLHSMMFYSGGIGYSVGDTNGIFEAYTMEPKLSGCE